MGAHTLPDGFIWLGDAFERAWEAIEDGKRLALAAERQVPDPKFAEAMGGGNWMQCDPAALRKQDESRRRVENRMRTALATGGIRAFIRDPKTGEPGELADREKWWGKVSFGIPGLTTALHPLTCPGPETGGRPVFLKESELQALIRGLSHETSWLEHGELIARTPWQLPAGAKADRLTDLGTGLFLPLSGVVSFLAFGKPFDPPEMDPFVCAHYRTRAAGALFKAAGEGRVRLFGTCSLAGPPGFIPEAVFVDKLAVSDDGADFDVCPTAADFQTFVRWREGKADSRRWLNVTVERNTLCSWLRTLTSPGDKKQRVTRSATPADLERIRSALGPLVKVRQIISFRKEHFPDVSRDNLIHACRDAGMIDDKPGPKGPRRAKP